MRAQPAVRHCFSDRMIGPWPVANWGFFTASAPSDNALAELHSCLHDHVKPARVNLSSSYGAHGTDVPQRGQVDRMLRWSVRQDHGLREYM